MTRHLLLFPVFMAIICIASCKKSDSVVKKNTPTPIATDTTKTPVIVVIPPKTLFGQWDLRNEHYLKYKDGVQIMDVSSASAPYNLAYVIFNSDSTYKCLAMDWYPALSSYGVEKDEVAGTFSVADSSLSTSSYLAGLNTIYYGGPPNAPPTITAVSNKMRLRQFTDSTLTVHQEYVFNYDDQASDLNGNYKYVWDLIYSKHGR